jgi:plastocyanin
MRNVATLSLGAVGAVALTVLMAFVIMRDNGLAAGRRPGHLEEADLDRQHPAPHANHGPAKTIAIDGTRFQPGDITVTVNDTVEWVNKDPFPHNVSSKIGGFRSGDLPPDRKWRFQPTTRGTFTYVCTLHPGMKAVLRVR